MVSSLAKAKQLRLPAATTQSTWLWVSSGPQAELLLLQPAIISTLCFCFTAKRCHKAKAVPYQQPRVCSTKLSISHTKARCEGNSGLHKGPQPLQTVHNHLENKGRKWQSSFVHAALGNTQERSPCDCAWESSHPGLSGAQADLGTPAGWASQRLHTMAWPQQHRHSQPEQGLHREPMHSHTALDHKHSKALHHNPTATVCS